MNGRLRRAHTNLAVLREVCREWWVRAALLAVALLGAGVLAGFRVNVTRSYPLGLYLVVGDASAVERGSVVIVCLPPVWARFALRREILGPGRCEGGSYGLGKMVLGVGGDVVELRPDGLGVNGAPIPNGRTLKRDSHGRPMPHYPWGRHTLRPGELWLYSPFHPGTFDSRYFGPVTVTRVQAVIRPVWTDASPHQPTSPFRIVWDRHVLQKLSRDNDRRARLQPYETIPSAADAACVGACADIIRNAACSREHHRHVATKKGC